MLTISTCVILKHSGLVTVQGVELLITYMCLTIDGVWIGWLDLLHLYTQLVTKSNYSATANVQNLQITDTHKPLSSVYYSLHYPFPGNGF
jgi:hypothetical protein